MVNSRAKGVRGELQVRDLFVERGYVARRGRQFSGSADSPDVEIDGEAGAILHLEVKLGQAPSIFKAMEQCESDRGPGQSPVVFLRRNGEEWLITMREDLFFELLAHRCPPPNEPVPAAERGKKGKK